MNRSEKLEAYLQEVGIDSTPELRCLLLDHLDLVIEKNKVMNLTRITSEDEALIKHLVDSLLFSTVMDYKPEYLLDIGTGAGFPGIPLSLFYDCRSLLIDSVGKKVRAVQEFIGELGLNQSIAAQAVRAEDLALQKRGSFDLVVARAVAETAVLLEYAAPLLKKNGSLVVSTGKLTKEDIAHIKKVAPLCGYEIVSRETLSLPKEMGSREILRYDKVGKEKIRLPRPNGMAKSKPLYLQ